MKITVVLIKTKKQEKQTNPAALFLASFELSLANYFEGQNRGLFTSWVLELDPSLNSFFFFLIEV